LRLRGSRSRSWGRLHWKKTFKQGFRSSPHCIEAPSLSSLCQILSIALTSLHWPLCFFFKAEDASGLLGQHAVPPSGMVALILGVVSHNKQHVTQDNNKPD
jgi:hypothetical protein